VHLFYNDWVNEGRSVQQDEKKPLKVSDIAFSFRFNTKTNYFANPDESRGKTSTPWTPWRKCDPEIISDSTLLLAIDVGDAGFKPLDQGGLAQFIAREFITRISEFELRRLQLLCTDLTSGRAALVYDGNAYDFELVDPTPDKCNTQIFIDYKPVIITPIFQLDSAPGGVRWNLDARLKQVFCQSRAISADLRQHENFEFGFRTPVSLFLSGYADDGDNLSDLSVSDVLKLIEGVVRGEFEIDSPNSLWS
jgi:hypothetical protein